MLLKTMNEMMAKPIIMRPPKNADRPEIFFHSAFHSGFVAPLYASLFVVA